MEVTKKKETGILLPVASLPSPWGIGSLGKEAFTLVDMLAAAGYGIWQILPLNPLGFGNSPYQPYSSFAGDEIYISLETLGAEGLIEGFSAPNTIKETGHITKIDYEAARRKKLPYLLQACSRFQPTAEYEAFAAWKWVRTYSVYKAFSKANGGICWNQWPEWQKFWPERQEGSLEAFKEEIRYQSFVQFVFYRQWMKLKQYAGSKGLRIMGDVPFYVGLDSQDVWAAKENFLLDQDGRPTFIAGVPPDYFSVTGQRWGNPIYDWEHLKQEQYRFWAERIGYHGSLFDIVRIDHFRAFDTFWKIPASCPTAIEGQWVEAPGYEAIDAILEADPGITLVAEDLGLLRPEVCRLKEHYGLKGMKILQFTLQAKGKRAVDDFTDVENMIMYTGTHDNTTIKAWYDSQNTAARRKIRRFLKEQKCTKGSVVQRLLSYAMKSPAQWVIVPMADVLELGQSGRINTPGTVGSPNWEWQMTGFEGVKERLKRINGYRR